MNATMLGLGVAIPCMVAFSFLMNRTNRLIGDVDGAAVRALDILKQRYYAAEVAMLASNEEDTGMSEKGHDKVAQIRRTA